MEISEAQEDRDKGRRAEEVVVWFLRLNGVFTIQNFVVHPDKVSRTPLAEADVLGIRMSNSFEGVNRSGKALRLVDNSKINRFLPTLKIASPIVTGDGYMTLDALLAAIL